MDSYPGAFYPDVTFSHRVSISRVTHVCVRLHAQLAWGLWNEPGHYIPPQQLVRPGSTRSMWNRSPMTNPTDHNPEGLMSVSRSLMMWRKSAIRGLLTNSLTILPKRWRNAVNATSRLLSNRLAPPLFLRMRKFPILFLYRPG